MNGISLLLVLSSLGATTSVELDANYQPVYTIRIESLLINELRAGQPIPINVAAKDRKIRRFKIAMTPDVNSRTGGLSRASDVNSRSADLVDYEATQLQNGEIEFIIQISPERLESLAAGKAIEGDIAQEVPEVDRYLIFVGMGQLPSQIQAATLAGAEIRTTPGVQSRNNAPPPAKVPAQSAFNARTNDPRTNYRNQPDESRVNPPPFTNAWQQGTSQLGTSQQGNSQLGTSQLGASQGNTLPRSSLGLPAAVDRNAYANQPPYNNQYPQPAYPDPNAGYAQPNSAPYPQQGYGQNSPVGYPPQQPTLAARNEVPPAQQNAAQPNTTAWASPPVNNQTVAQAPTTTTPAAKIETIPERPWTPLILTTLALFASMGANAYLGWLSWSFFWRFRDAVTEAARARANHSSIRQAA